VLLTQKVIEEGGRDSTAIIDILEKKPEILRTLPAFFNIQIVEGCPQACFYCPYPSFGGDILNKREYMELDTFAALCKRITEFADDAVISVSLWGEPALHPHMAELVAEVARHPKLSLLIETSGIGWQEETLKNIRDNAPSTLDWIVSIDSYDQQLYHQLRGDGMKQALHTVDTLFELFPEHVYIQAVRMQLNEENLETFYREWKKRTDNIIIQKYDHFAGYLPQRKVTDLSPLKRFPCWHLKRDMVILLNGAVPLCREDIQSQYQLGNVFHDTIERLWNRGESFYREHLREEYNSLCGECDEYYTFNF
jgi:spiro-SPASM protein